MARSVTYTSAPLIPSCSYAFMLRFSGIEIMGWKHPECIGAEISNYGRVGLPRQPSMLVRTARQRRTTRQRRSYYCALRGRYSQTPLAKGVSVVVSLYIPLLNYMDNESQPSLLSHSLIHKMHRRTPLITNATKQQGRAAATQRMHA